MMFESNLFKFAESIDTDLIQRLRESTSIKLTPEELEQVKELRFKLFDVLELKTSALKGVSRNMMEVSGSNETYADNDDHLNLWYLVTNELDDIKEVQDIIFALDRAIFNSLGGVHDTQ